MTRANVDDALTGLSLAGLLLPEAVAYSGLANLPPQAGVIGLFAGRIFLHGGQHGFQQRACREVRVRPQNNNQTFLSEFFARRIGGF